MYLARTLGAWFNKEGLLDMERDLSTNPAGFVAREGVRIVGFATWAPLEGGVADLRWIGVEESKQRSGIGTALLRAVVSQVRALGFKSIEVSTVAETVPYPPYERTRQFYQARGFRPQRVDPLFYRKGSDRYDRVVLALPIDPGARVP
jgi:GNAT superfamily N-acetyltransferase